jgi:putative ABC transport system permease protein
MTLKQIAIRNLLRRKGKAALILLGLVLGIGTVITVISFADAVTGDINHKLEKYGANILIVPRTESLSLKLRRHPDGRHFLRHAGTATRPIWRGAPDQERTQYRRHGAGGPGGRAVNDRPVMLAGVDFEEARILKPWWKIEGAARRPTVLLAGAEAARVLGLQPGDRVAIAGRIQ